MIGWNSKGEIVFASHVSAERLERLRAARRRLAVVVIPEGYATAKEFAEDCGFELVSEAGGEAA